MKRIATVLLTSCFVGTSFAQISLGKIKEKAQTVIPGGTTESKLTNEEVVSGLKEALSVGTNNSSEGASKVDGFNKNELIRIPFPEEAIKVKEKAEKWGMQKQVEEFELTMNRAAEEASKDAGPIFLEAIKNISVSDGFAILKGEENAATMFLKKGTYDELKAKFMPIIKTAVEKAEVTKYWNPMITKYNKATKLTGGDEINPDLDDYICEKALTGLFTLIAAEELKIRQDPMARVSDLLQRVFGSITE